MGLKFETLQTRAKRLGWRLRRIRERGPLAARYTLSIVPGDAMRASHLRVFAALVAAEERRRKRK